MLMIVQVITNKIDSNRQNTAEIISTQTTNAHRKENKAEL